MKNIFSKITGFALGLAMAIGVGIGISQNVSFVESKAATKITDYTKITNGDYYIGATTSSTDYYLNVPSTVGTKVAGTAKTSTSDATIFTISVSETSATIKIKSSGNYLQLNSADANGKVDVVASSTKNWTMSNASSAIKFAFDSTHSLQKNNSGTQFGSYKNTQTNLFLLPATVSYLSELEISSDKNSIDVGSTATLDYYGLDTEGNEWTGPVTYSSSNETVATIDGDTLTGLSAGTTTVTAKAVGAGTGGADVDASNSLTITVVAAAAVNYEKYTGELTAGNYILCSGSVAMGNVVSSDRLSYESVTVTNDVISTSNKNIVWTLAQSGDYYTLFNSAVSKYAASTGAKNKAGLLDDGTDDKSLWAVDYDKEFASYDFVNKKNTENEVNATLRYNSGYGFACYATGTGSKLTLYKQEDTRTTKSLAVTGSMTKTEYLIGNSWDPSGLTVTATLSDDSEIDVTSEASWTYNPAAPNSTSITSVVATASYTRKGETKTADSAAQSVTVEENPIVVTGVSITDPATSPVSIGASTLLYSTAQITANVTYDGTVGTNELTWTSSAEDVVSVDATGKVTFLKDGDATITATSVENVTKYASVTYNVNGLKGASKESPLCVADFYDNIDRYTGKVFYVTGYITDFADQNKKYPFIRDTLSTEEEVDKIEIYSYAPAFDECSSIHYIPGSKITAVGFMKKYNTVYEICNVDGNTPVRISINSHEEPTSVSKETAPKKVTYKPGETFDPTGLEISVVRPSYTQVLAYSNTLEGISFSPALGTTLTEENTKVTVTFEGKSFDIDITVAKVLDAITVDESSTAEDEYFEGAKFNPTGLVLKLDYAAPTEDATVAYNETTKGDFGFNPSLDTALAPSDNKVTISYGGKSVDMPITVTAKAVSTVAIKTDATKKAYYVGDNFDPAGLVVTVTYNNSDVEDVTYSETNKADFTFTPATFSAAGNVDVAVTYKSVAAGNIAVTVTAVELVSIAVKTNPTKTSYLVDEQLDLTGLVLTATYNNGTQNDVTEGYTADPVDMSTEGTKTVTVKYGGKSTTFEIVVSAKVILNSIEVVSNPTKTSYFVGETFSSEGLVIKATYSDSTIKNVTDYTLSTPDMSTAGKKTITVTYVEESITKTTTFDIQVVAIAVQSILVKTQPTKTVYTVGDTFSAAGLVIEATNNDGSKRDLADTEYQLSTPDMTTAGVKTVTVTYAEGITTSFEITVNAPVVITNLEIVTNPSKMEYVIGEKFDMTGLVLKATYSDGTTVQPVSGFTCDAPEKFSNAGVYKITFSFEGKDVSINVTVKEQSRVVGCGGSVIAASAILSLTAIAGAALLLLKKKEN